MQKRIVSSHKIIDTFVLNCIGCTHMFDGVGHGVSAGAAQGEVQHHNLIGSDESSDRHNKDQVPEEDIKGSMLERGLMLFGLMKGDLKPCDTERTKTHTDSLANERDGKRRLRDLLSNKEEEDSLSQQDGDGHSQLLSPSCEGDNRDLGDKRPHQIKPNAFSTFTVLRH